MFLRFLKIINWFLTKQKSTPIVDEPTSEKIIMETQTNPVVQIRDWSIDRIDELSEGDIESQFNAVAIAEEFDEWINVRQEDGEMEYLCLEDKGFGDQEIDVI